MNDQQDEKTTEEKQDELQKDFVELVAPVMVWMSDNFHDNVTITISGDSAELAHGLMGITKEAAMPSSDSLH